MFCLVQGGWSSVGLSLDATRFAVALLLLLLSSLVFAAPFALRRFEASNLHFGRSLERNAKHHFAASNVSQSNDLRHHAPWNDLVNGDNTEHVNETKKLEPQIKRMLSFVHFQRSQRSSWQRLRLYRPIDANVPKITRPIACARLNDWMPLCIMPSFLEHVAWSL